MDHKIFSIALLFILLIKIVSRLPVEMSIDRYVFVKKAKFAENKIT